jgi:hypothetical protein
VALRSVSTLFLIDLISVRPLSGGRLPDSEDVIADDVDN